LTVVLLLL